MTRQSNLILKRWQLACLILVQTACWAPGSQAESIAQQQLAEGITLEVNSLRRINDQVLQLDFTVVNGTGKIVQPHKLGLAASGAMNGLRLLDMHNLQLYTVGSVSGLGYLCSKEVPIPANGQQTYYAQYAAPPPDVTGLAIQFPVAPPLFDIPIAE